MEEKKKISTRILDVLIVTLMVVMTIGTIIALILLGVGAAM